jgi:DNA-binding MarR family transcriptional regulator
MDIYRELFLMQQTYATLFSLANKLQVEGDKYFQSLTGRQFMAMVAIIHLPEEETTLNNIAAKLGTTKQSVKQLIEIIEKKGYVITLPSLKDKRAVNLKITESGKQVMLECNERGLHFFVDLFKNFTAGEMEILWGLLKKLYSFDGKTQDGFEAGADLEITSDQTEAQMKVLQEFEKCRNQSRNERK